VDYHSTHDAYAEVVAATGMAIHDVTADGGGLYGLTPPPHEVAAAVRRAFPVDRSAEPQPWPTPAGYDPRTRRWPPTTGSPSAPPWNARSWPTRNHRPERRMKPVRQLYEVRARRVPVDPPGLVSLRLRRAPRLKRSRPAQLRGDGHHLTAHPPAADAQPAGFADHGRPAAGQRPQR
jgi:hypothetical protein